MNKYMYRTKWKQSGNKNLKVGQEWEQSGNKKLKVGQEQSGNKVGTRPPKWNKNGNKVGTKRTEHKWNQNGHQYFITIRRFSKLMCTFNVENDFGKVQRILGA